MTIKFLNNLHFRVSAACYRVCSGGGRGSDAVDYAGSTSSSKGVSLSRSSLGFLFDCEVEGAKIRRPFVPCLLRGMFSVPLREILWEGVRGEE